MLFPQLAEHRSHSLVRSNPISNSRKRARVECVVFIALVTSERRKESAKSEFRAYQWPVIGVA